MDFLYFLSFLSQQVKNRNELRQISMVDKYQKIVDERIKILCKPILTRKRNRKGNANYDK